jgi:Homeodomain-like domain
LDRGVRSAIREGDLVVVPIKRTDFTAAELRAAGACADDTRVTRRALAIAMVLDGYPRATAAELSGMDRQALRDWVHRLTLRAWRDYRIVHGLVGLLVFQPSRCSKSKLGSRQDLPWRRKV